MPYGLNPYGLWYRISSQPLYHVFWIQNTFQFLLLHERKRTMFKYSSFSNKYENYTNGGGSNFYSLSSSRIDLGGRTPLVDGDPLATAVVTARISSTTTSAGQRTRQRRWNYGSWIRIVNTNGVEPIEFWDGHPLHVEGMWCHSIALTKKINK